MAVDRTRTLRGAIAGAAAAAVWAAQQPLDMKVFGSRYDDAELLGSFLTSGRRARPLGAAMHVANGAVFGAVYANVAPSLPVPAWARGPLAAVGEHVSLWPLARVLPLVHPRPDAVPPLWGNTAAFAQATWRHLLFGVVLGELERRLNPPLPAVADAEPVAAATSNGHGSADRIVAVATPSATG